MIVLDASVVVELLIGGPLAASLQEALTERNEALAVPHVLDVEVTSALRNLAIAGRIDAHRAAHLIHDLAELPAERWPHTPFLKRIWELRHNFTAYDAAYVALTEATNGVLFTADAKLLRGHAARVLFFRQ